MAPGRIVAQAGRGVGTEGGQPYQRNALLHQPDEQHGCAPLLVYQRFQFRERVRRNLGLERLRPNRGRTALRLELRRWAHLPAAVRQESRAREVPALLARRLSVAPGQSAETSLTTL